MRFRSSLVSLATIMVLSFAFVSNAFSPSLLRIRSTTGKQLIRQHLSDTRTKNTLLLLSSTVNNNVFDYTKEQLIGSTIFSGEPTSRAKSINTREVIRQANFLRVTNDVVNIDDLIGPVDDSSDTTSIVVFLRSLGWPLCQEYIRQWYERIDVLETNGIRLVMISIGLPEKGRILIDHLNLGAERGPKYLFVDPENALYDLLDLNRGIQRTFFNVNTPYAFLRRFTEKDGMEDLVNILSRWKDGK
jgi:hypothetical protein